MSIRGRKTKKCPRCGNQCLISQVKCDECGLLFGRLDNATNREGRKRLRRREKELVVYVKKCPLDIKKWKLILMVLFTGLFGGHYFYVGRWKWGLGMLIYFFAVLFMGVIFNSYFLTIWSGTFFSIFGPLTGLYTIVWLNDIRRICFNTFKIPVSIIGDKEEKEYNEIKQQKKNKNIEIRETTEKEKEIVVESKKEDKK